MSEAAKPGAVPSLGEALGWRGFALDAAGGVEVGRIEGVFVDAESGDPVPTQQSSVPEGAPAFEPQFIIPGLPPS